VELSVTADGGRLVTFAAREPGGFLALQSMPKMF
jgi:hypothetical protein